METPNTNNNQSNPPNGTGSNNPPGDNARGIPGSNPNAGSTHTIHHEPINITIPQNEEENRTAIEANRLSDIANSISKRANRVSIAELIIAIAVFVFTFLLFNETRKANKTASDALQLNQDQFKQSKIDNERNRKEQAKTDSENNFRYRKQFALDSTSTQAQIDALKESQSQFTVANKPYLQISFINEVVFEVGKPISGTINIENLGNYPVKLIAGETYIATKIVPPDTTNNTILGMPQSSQLISNLISKGNDGRIGFNDGTPLNQNRYDMVTNKTWSIYVYGYCVYKNLISNRIGKYNFMMRFRPNESNQELFY